MSSDNQGDTVSSESHAQLHDLQSLIMSGPGNGASILDSRWMDS